MQSGFLKGYRALFQQARHLHIVEETIQQLQPAEFFFC